MRDITLITGGSRSGKSGTALCLAEPYSPKIFIATAEACDDEMRDRIRRHRADRSPDFRTIEEPLDLAAALRTAADSDAQVTVVDCLTVWLGNLMHRHGDTQDDFPEVQALLDTVTFYPGRLLLVTNEVGMGVVPDTPLGRRFRDLAGTVNQQLAARVDRVVLVVSGIPLTLKGTPL